MNLKAVSAVEQILLECESGVRTLRPAIEIVTGLIDKGFAIVPLEATSKMVAASMPAFEEVEGAIQIAWVHGFTLTAKVDDPPIKQAWRAMVGAAQG